MSITETLPNFNSNDIITFNIGGTIYSTKRSTITDNVDSQSYLALILKNPTNDNGKYFIDRDGKYFSYILNYFRDKKILLPENLDELKEILIEAKFYQIDRLVNEIENYLNRTNEKTKQDSTGFQFNLISKFNPKKTLVKLIGPLKLISVFQIQFIGESFLKIISSFNNPTNILCQFTFPYDEKFILCQPFDLLQRFVLAKQAKKMGLIVSYCDDYIYIPIEHEIISRDQLAQVLFTKYHGKILNTNMINNDDSYNLVETWFLPIKSEDIYSNSSVHY